MLLAYRRSLCRMFSTVGIPKTDLVAVAMSGGVDSSVSALLLKEQRYNLIGVFMRNWDEIEENGVCTSEKDFRKVQQVCQDLGIPCRRVDFVREYWNRVFQQMVDDYSRGVTPNPDVACNREIKFAALLEHVKLVFGAKWLATGHYAGVRLNQYGTAQLACARDQWKDQTYFLSQMSQSALSQAIFPLHNLTKPEVRVLARKNKLTTAEAQESMGICFVGKKKRFSDFLAQYIPDNPGYILSYDDHKVIGEHRGIHHYTIGQGLRLSGKLSKWYACKLDAQANVVYAVDDGSHAVLMVEALTVKQFHWISGTPPHTFLAEGSKLRCHMRFRHQMDLTPCVVLTLPDGRYLIELSRKHRGASPGQIAALYHWNDGFEGSYCYGSGIIEAAVSTKEINSFT